MITAYPIQRAVLGGRAGIQAAWLSVFDPAALAFFAKGVSLGEAPLSATEKNAVNGLVLQFKQASIWTKSELLYPFVGGTAVWHSLNLKDPDTFQVTWAGTLTHNSNGVTGNGSDGWGDTGWATSAASIASLDSVSLFAYNRTQAPVSGGRFLGVSNTAGTSRLGMIASGGNLNSDGPHDGDSDTVPSINTITPDFRGTMLLSRTSSTAHANYIRDLSPGSDSQSSTSTCTGTLGILARNFESFGPDSFSDANLALAGAGSGMSAADYASLNAAIKNFQDALGRNVAD